MSTRTANLSLLVFAVVAAVAGLPATSMADITYTPISIGAIANARFQTFQPYAAFYPEGNVTLGGVPFDIENVKGNNVWAASHASGSNPRTLSLPVNVTGATAVYTIIQQEWGQPGPTSYTSLEFYGSAGAFFRKDLIGDVDIRDHLYGDFTSTINGTTTMQVFSAGSGLGQQVRLDMQTILLPTEFQNQTLSTIRVIDTGANAIDRTLLYGATVASIPEPASLALVGLGTTLLLIRRRR